MAEHDHSNELMVWCHNCQTKHVSTIPAITFRCRDCGWAQQVYSAGHRHLIDCPGHAITDVRHPVSELEHDTSKCCRACGTHVTPHKGCSLE